MEYKTVGNDLRSYRLEAGLTQEELAKAIGVTRQTVIAMEKGNYVPSVLLALLCAKLFGRAVEDPSLVKPYTEDAQATGFKPGDFAPFNFYAARFGSEGLPPSVVEALHSPAAATRIGGSTTIMAGR